jgi:hypothetical protein
LLFFSKSADNVPADPTLLVTSRTSPGFQYTCDVGSHENVVPVFVTDRSTLVTVPRTLDHVTVAVSELGYVKITAVGYMAWGPEFVTVADVVNAISAKMTSSTSDQALELNSSTQAAANGSIPSFFILHLYCPPTIRTDPVTLTSLPLVRLPVNRLISSPVTTDIIQNTVIELAAPVSSLAICLDNVIGAPFLARDSDTFWLLPDAGSRTADPDTRNVAGRRPVYVSVPLDAAVKRSSCPTAHGPGMFVDTFWSTATVISVLVLAIDATIDESVKLAF